MLNQVFKISNSYFGLLISTLLFQTIESIAINYEDSQLPILIVSNLKIGIGILTIVAAVFYISLLRACFYVFFIFSIASQIFILNMAPKGQVFVALMLLTITEFVFLFISLKLLMFNKESVYIYTFTSTLYYCGVCSKYQIYNSYQSHKLLCIDCLCYICRNQLHGEQTIILDCGHKFHKNCIDDSLVKWSVSCPRCA
ncbi:MAG: hypothetical protein EB127_28285 [Alphaproteobacteria bacterium]|nr:hypothetical protein [Alphaproteobacteria bacterium]